MGQLDAPWFSRIGDFVNRIGQPPGATLHEPPRVVTARKRLIE